MALADEDAAVGAFDYGGDDLNAQVGAPECCFRIREERGRGEGCATAGTDHCLLDVAMKNLDEVFGGACFAGIHFGGFAENVRVDFAIGVGTSSKKK
jgi:hypothetical protein